MCVGVVDLFMKNVCRGVCQFISVYILMCLSMYVSVCMVVYLCEYVIDRRFVGISLHLYRLITLSLIFFVLFASLLFPLSPILFLVARCLFYLCPIVSLTQVNNAHPSTRLYRCRSLSLYAIPSLLISPHE